MVTVVQKDDSSASAEPSPFESRIGSIMNVFIMSLGEIDKVKTWINMTPHVPHAIYETDTLILLATFLFLMPIVLMNLLVSGGGRR